MQKKFCPLLHLPLVFPFVTEWKQETRAGKLAQFQAAVKGKGKGEGGGEEGRARRGREGNPKRWRVKH